MACCGSSMLEASRGGRGIASTSKSAFREKCRIFGGLQAHSLRLAFYASRIARRLWPVQLENPECS